MITDLFKRTQCNSNDMIMTRGGGRGGREGSSAPPHLSKISLTLGIFFFENPSCPLSKTHQGANIFQEDRAS